MRKLLFLYGCLSVSFLFSKTFESSKILVNYDVYQDNIQVKSPISAVISDANIELFDYDNLGNLTKDNDKSYIYNDFGQISKIIFNDGRVVDLSYDNLGRLSNFGPASFAYNDFNMMSSFKDSVVNAEYFYDAKTGYRSSKVINGVKYDFDLDDRGRLLRQKDSLGNVTEIVWDEELPKTLTFNGKTYNFICNDHGDVINLVLKDGELVNSYEYDIYGKVLSEVESVPNPIRYAHEYYDSESKLYYLRGRYYNPDTKSFTTPDPAEADARLYSYAGYNPIDFIDPSGYFFVTKKEGTTGRTIYLISEDDLKEIPKAAKQILAKKPMFEAGNFADFGVAIAAFWKKFTWPSFIYSTLRAFGFLTYPDSIEEAMEGLMEMAMEAYRNGDELRVTKNSNDSVIIERRHKNKDGSLTIDIKTFRD